MSEILPVGLRLAGRPVLVVGGGEVAESKIAGLLERRARITVVAPDLTPDLQHLVDAGQITWQARTFQPDDVAGQLLVVACTGRQGIDPQVFAACEARATLCTAADVPECSTAWWMAQRQVGNLTLAIGTTGTAPGLTRRLLADALSGLPTDVAQHLDRYAQLRRWLQTEHAPGEHLIERRTDALRWLASRSWRFFTLPWQRQTQLLAARYALGRTAVPR